MKYTANYVISCMHMDQLEPCVCDSYKSAMLIYILGILSVCQSEQLALARGCIVLNVVLNHGYHISLNFGCNSYSVLKESFQSFFNKTNTGCTCLLLTC